MIRRWGTEVSGEWSSSTITSGSGGEGTFAFALLLEAIGNKRVLLHSKHEKFPYAKNVHGGVSRLFLPLLRSRRPPEGPRRPGYRKAMAAPAVHYWLIRGISQLCKTLKIWQGWGFPAFCTQPRDTPLFLRVECARLTLLGL
jgi:hypothetical protein